MTPPPDEYRNAGMAMAAAGALAVCWYGVWAFGAFTSIFGGVLCGPCICWVPLLAMPAAVYEVVVGLRMSQGRPAPTAPTVQIVSIVLMGMHCLMLGVMIELFALVMLRKPEVQAWLEQAEAEAGRHARIRGGRARGR